MSNIDEQIRNALAAEDQKAIDEIDDSAGIFELVGLTFKGKQAWISYYMYFLGIVVSALFVYFVIQYLGTSDIKSSLNWALLILGCGFAFTMLKILGWQQIQKTELMREIKRLEMRIMLVSEQNQQ
ncbi:MAG: hypothetical protein JKY40_02495 [Gammaproteobacteria bacterium]|nr:hypothetical protein [Gammaproteobacteria bacterium]MBL4728223.1 hypothetical protein [Gammaproteobacteria bacterium]